MPENERRGSEDVRAYSRPYRTASYLAIIAGALVAANGVFWLLIGQAYSVTLDDSPYAVYTISVTGFVFGLMIIAAGIMVNREVDHDGKMSWTAVIAIFSALSLTLAAGGFIIGFILAMVAIWIVIRVNLRTNASVKVASKH